MSNSLTQWQCLLKNLEEWRGSFTSISAEGEIINNTSAVAFLEGREHN
ncbi:DUF3598 family protein [Gloeocapsa sp. PCC 73106]|nr:DUF3598 family protein [Gloeocapsa sp. PCC 73106]ELR96536.1 protein of unknown function (DUF3598) [Gloeocapsa sp. PCC 73106]